MALNLSYLDGSNGFRLYGAGYSVAGAGDVNGDRIDDLIVGAPWANESYVVFGSAAGFGASLDVASLDGTNGFKLAGIDANDYSGRSVAGAGDVNGDGIDDLIVGAPYADGRAGASFVVFGSAAGFRASLDLGDLDGTNGFRIEGIEAYDTSGWSVAGAGDVNGDGIDDLIVGAPYADGRAGASFVVFGSAAGFGASLDLGDLDGTNGFRIEGIEAYDTSGWSVAGAGDVNGDGIGDLVVGAPGRYGYYSAGESYVVFGSAAGFSSILDLAALDGTNGFRLDGIDDYDHSGFSVAGAGDFNGDGIDDIIIGARNAQASFLVFGSATGFTASIDLAALDGADGFRLDGSGLSVAGAGDINGDGIDDLIVGPPSLGYSSTGDSYAVFGSASGFAASLDVASLDGTDGFRLDGSFVTGFRSPVAGAGDVNGDGIDDLIVGANGESDVVFGSTLLGGKNDAPSAADDVLSVEALDVVDLAADHGAGSDRDPDLDTLSITAIDGTPVTTGDSVTLASGLRVTVLDAARVRFEVPQSALGTVLSDSFVYEISDGRGGRDTASVSVDCAASAIALSILDGSNGFRIDGAAGDYAGRSVAGAGDVNGDGIDDLIVDNHVVFGSAAGFAASLDLAALDGTDGFRLDSNIDGFRVGSVAGAGDINGDGIDDLFIGGYRNEYFDDYCYSASFVVFGTGAGFPSNLDLASLDVSKGFRLDGDTSFSYVGSVGAGAGDINGDGFDDLIIVDNGFDYYTNFIGGAAYVVFGTGDGFEANLDLATLDGNNGFRLNGEKFHRSSVAGAGDVNGDGFDDVIVGAPLSYDPYYYNAGKSYVVFGSAAGFAESIDLAALDGSNGFRLDGLDFSGSSVAGTGDVNGDGFGDMIVGANGTSYVVFGSAADFPAVLDLTALDGSDGFRLDGVDFAFGRASVAGAGDFNGDGIADLIVGAPEANSRKGASYLVFGSTTGFAPSLDVASLDGTNGFRLDGIDFYDESGQSVAGAGDVNGDGFDDLVIGAPLANHDEYYGSAGESYVIFGFATGGAGVTLTGTRGADTLTGTTGDDRIFGLGGRDSLVGLGGDDLLKGAAGRDAVEGGDGADRLYGGRGRDALEGGAGDDRLSGGPGSDVFVFAAAFGADRIGGFDAAPRGGQDRIDFSGLGITAAGFAAAVAVSDLGEDTLVEVAGFGSMLLADVTGDGANAISEADFLFA